MGTGQFADSLSRAHRLLRPVPTLRAAGGRPVRRLLAPYAWMAVAAGCLMLGDAGAQVVVTTTADIPVDQADCVTAGSDTCTLRAAIDRLNRFVVNPRRIVFNLPGPGPHVIRLEPTLGSLNWTSSGELDGLSQQGAGRRFGSDPENPVDYVLQVGVAAPLFQTLNGPLMVISGGGILRGIAFFDHDGVGVRLQRGAISQSFFNTLNGTNPGPRTLTTGVEYRATNTGSSVGVYSSLFMGPGRGVELFDARTSGTEAIAQPIVGESYFGTDRTGLLSRPLEYGVLAQITTTPPVIFGRLRPVEAVIRDSLFYRAERNAIRLRGTRPILEGIFIGYDAAGARVTGAQPATQGAGILMEGPTYAEDGDGGRIGYVRIHGQRGPGIQLDDTHGPITSLEILPAVTNARSSIFGNGGLGISLNPAAPATPILNDAGDADTGPNGRQNHPVIENIQRTLDGQGNERLAVRLRLESRPNRAYRLQFFTNSVCDPSGHGEGEAVLASEFDENGGELLTDANGIFSGTIMLAGQGMNTLLERLDGRPFVTALATDDSDFATGERGNTSEFSPCYDARILDPPGQQLGFDRRQYTFREGQTASVLVQRTGGTTGEVRVLLETFDGTALAGRDYTTVRRDLVFANGINTFGVQIPLRADDTEAQSTRQFTVALVVPTGGTGGATIDPFRAEATVRIEDDDVDYQVTDSVGAETDGQMDFGAVEYGAFVEGTVTIRNLGEPRLSFGSIEFVRLPADSRFREVGRTCGPFLDQDQSCTVTVRFEPGDLTDTPSAVPVVAQGQIAIVPTAGPSRVVTVNAVAPPRADLSVDIAVNQPNPRPSQSVTYTVTVRNFGPSAVAASEVAAQIPEGLIIIALRAPSGTAATYDAATRTVSWDVGSLTVTTASATPPALEFDALVNPDVAQGAALGTTARVTRTDPRRLDTNGGNNVDTVEIRVGVAAADLAVTEIRVPNRRIWIDLEQGNSSSQTMFITVRNNGPDAPEGPIQLTFGSDSQDVWVCRFRGTECERVEAIELDPALLAPGRSQTVDVWIVATRRAPPFISIGAGVSSPTFDPDRTNNSRDSGTLEVMVSNTACFVATAAYGSWLDPHVITLRAFRDQWLLTNTPGRAFVAWYYRVSPPLADLIAERKWARTAARGALAPVVFTIERPGPAGVMALLVLGGLWRLRKRPRRSAEVTP